MAISFDDLCEELKLPQTYQQESNLISIEDWCRENISQDVRFSGDSASQYRKYLTFVENYLDNFMANLPKDLATKISFYGDSNAIHYAAQQGYDRFIATQSGITEGDINEGDTYDMTPLHKAATQGHFFTVQALINKGADVHKIDRQGQLPIQKALFVPMLYDETFIETKEKIVRELLPLTPELATHVDMDGNSLLHLLATHGFNNLMADVLNQYKSLAFVRNRAFRYPIYTAILNNQLNAAKLLLAVDNVAEQKDEQNRLPIHYAARYGTAEMVQACCDATSDINSKDSEGRTPLLWAAYAGNLDALSTLIDNGADPKMTDSHGYSILNIAKNENNESLVNWINHHLDCSLLTSEHSENQKPLL